MEVEWQSSNGGRMAVVNGSPNGGPNGGHLFSHSATFRNPISNSPNSLARSRAVHNPTQPNEFGRRREKHFKLDARWNNHCNQSLNLARQFMLRIKIQHSTQCAQSQLALVLWPHPTTIVCVCLPSWSLDRCVNSWGCLWQACWCHWRHRASCLRTWCCCWWCSLGLGQWGIFNKQSVWMEKSRVCFYPCPLSFTRHPVMVNWLTLLLFTHTPRPEQQANQSTQNQQKVIHTNISADFESAEYERTRFSRDAIAFKTAHTKWLHEQCTIVPKVHLQSRPPYTPPLKIVPAAIEINALRFGAVYTWSMLLYNAFAKTERCALYLDAAHKPAIET